MGIYSKDIIGDGENLIGDQVVLKERLNQNKISQMVF